jgi:hypothetical protein
MGVQMSTKNYLELVNEVLIRLREDPVTSVNQNKYSRLIALYINDAKRQIEDAYNWNALSDTLTIQTSPDLFNYVLTGAGIRFRVIDFVNGTSDWFLEYQGTSAMNDLFLNQPIRKGPPQYYNFNGVNVNGDTQVDVYPIPDAAYELYLNIIKPQAELTQDSQQILIPSEPVIFLAYAKALAERGEDGGLSSSEAYGLYQNSLADHIAIEGNKYPEEFTWVAY